MRLHCRGCTQPTEEVRDDPLRREARKHGWLMAVAVVDPAGTLVCYEKMDNVQLASAKVAVNKARSAALYKRPTKAFQDALAGGGAGTRVLALEGAVPVEGGLPIVVGGKLVGASGLSGDLSENDGKCAAAGMAAVKDQARGGRSPALAHLTRRPTWSAG